MHFRCDFALQRRVDLYTVLIKLADKIHRFHGIPPKAGDIDDEQNIHFACCSSLDHFDKAVSVKTKTLAVSCEAPATLNPICSALT